MNPNLSLFSHSKKCMHPRVLKVLSKLQPPSPLIVPRDLSQPRAGNIRNLQNQNTYLVPVVTATIEKPQPVLTLDATLLKRRRINHTN